jgi:multidrug resistance efflux pump
MPDDLNYTEVHSEEVQDIIGRAPKWIVRKGNIIIACLVVLLLLGAWLIRYPDIISARVIISATAPPVKLVARASGRISEVDVKDGGYVKKDEVIAVIDNPANMKDMLYLREVAEIIDTTPDIRKRIIEIGLSRNLQVGEVQSDYAALFQAINNYNFFFNNKYYLNKRQVINKQQRDNDKIKEGIIQREKLLGEQLKIGRWKDSIHQILAKEKVIAPMEYNEIKKAYLSQSLTNTDNANSLLQTEQQQKEYEKSISDLQQQYKIEERDILAAIKDAAKRIKGQIVNWERQYILRSPIEGKLTFFRVWKENQYVTNGEPVFMIVPAVQQFEVRAQLPIYKAGKIKIGQKVLIKLQEYPYEEFGMLKAKVENFTNVALDSVYIVQLKLEKGLLTTRNRMIAMRPVINGLADIITNDKNILQRIFEGVYGKVYEQ